MFEKAFATGAAVAIVAAASLATSGAASARPHRQGVRHVYATKTMHAAKRMHVARAPRLIPAVAKPGYHSMVGTPTLIDPVPVAPHGGVLGLGILPSTGAFKGVPIVGDLGL